MTRNSKYWARCLTTYGSDFNHWRVPPAKGDHAAIKALSEYQDALALDNALAQASFPTPSTDLKAKTLQRLTVIQKQSASMPMAGSGLFDLLQRPAIMAACFALFLGLGLGSGVHYKNMTDTSQSGEYSYYALGPSYTYTSITGG